MGGPWQEKNLDQILMIGLQNLCSERDGDSLIEIEREKYNLIVIICKFGKIYGPIICKKKKGGEIRFEKPILEMWWLVDFYLSKYISHVLKYSPIYIHNY